AAVGEDGLGQVLGRVLGPQEDQDGSVAGASVPADAEDHGAAVHQAHVRVDQPLASLEQADLHHHPLVDHALGQQDQRTPAADVESLSIAPRYAALLLTHELVGAVPGDVPQARTQRFELRIARATLDGAHGGDLDVERLGVGNAWTDDQHRT